MDNTVDIPDTFILRSIGENQFFIELKLRTAENKKSRLHYCYPQSLSLQIQPFSSFIVICDICDPRWQRKANQNGKILRMEIQPVLLFLIV